MEENQNINQNTPVQNSQIPTQPGLPNDGAKKGKRKIIIGVFTLVILIVVVVGINLIGEIFFGWGKTVDHVPTLSKTATPTPDPTANWKTYTNNEMGFTIKYPSDWVEKLDPQGGVDSIYDPVSISPVKSNGDTTINIPFRYVDISAYKSASSAAESATNYLTNNPAYNSVDSKRKTILLNGMSAEMFIQSGEGGRGYTIVVSNGSSVAWINISSAYPTNDSAINQILSTFKFTDQNSTIETSSWKTYSGQTAYTTDGSSSFSIKYPSDWLLVGNALYPFGQNKDEGAVTKIILGAAGSDSGGTTNGTKQFPAGTAYFTTLTDPIYGVYEKFSFPKNNIAYIFDVRNLPLNLVPTVEQMISTFKFTN